MVLLMHFCFPVSCIVSLLQTWEEKKYIFSAVTSGIRGNWVQALRNAANLKEAKDRPLTLGEQIEREIVAKRDRHNSQRCVMLLTVPLLV